MTAYAGRLTWNLLYALGNRGMITLTRQIGIKDRVEAELTSIDLDDSNAWGYEKFYAWFSVDILSIATADEEAADSAAVANAFSV